MPVTIADVARQAGVSTATVSRVLAGLGGARPETRARIAAAARDLNYRPSGVARSLKLRTTKTFGLIITDIENPYFPQLVRAVEDAAHQEGYALVLCNAADDPDRESFYLDLLVDRRMDGVIIAASKLGERHRGWLRKAHLPIVLVNTPSRGVRLPAVTSDNRGGGRLAAGHLIELGHRRLGVLTAGPRNADAPLRLAGIQDAMLAAGLDPAALTIATGAATIVGGETAMSDLLDRDADVTGILAYNDLMAIGALRSVRARGGRVPDDVSVVGFDDVALSAYVEPPLTTVSQSTVDLGRLAVRQLIQHVRDALPATDGATEIERLPDRILVPVALRVRASTGPPPVRSAGPGRRALPSRA
jgi:Transcriptional regulators